MEIVIRHIEDCPHVDLAESRAQRALELLGFDATIQRMLVRSASEAGHLRFGGSPSITIDGEDLFPATDLPGLACRLYATETGLEGAPSIEHLVTALRHRDS